MSSTSNTNKSKPVVDKEVVLKPLSKQEQANVEAAKTHTKNNGSHIVKQREARLAQAKKENK